MSSVIRKSPSWSNFPDRHMVSNSRHARCTRCRWPDSSSLGSASTKLIRRSTSLSCLERMSFSFTGTCPRHSTVPKKVRDESLSDSGSVTPARASSRHAHKRRATAHVPRQTTVSLCPQQQVMRVSATFTYAARETCHTGHAVTPPGATISADSRSARRRQPSALLRTAVHRREGEAMLLKSNPCAGKPNARGALWHQIAQSQIG
jgi:hypothetical protein